MGQGVVGGISQVVDRTDEFRQGPKRCKDLGVRSPGASHGLAEDVCTGAGGQGGCRGP